LCYNYIMSIRLQKLESFKTHPWFKKLYAKLASRDCIFMLETLNKLDHLAKDEFEFKVNRLFLGVDDKPKHWKEIIELLNSCN